MTLRTDDELDAALSQQQGFDLVMGVAEGRLDLTEIAASLAG